jgi:hypothetical protein
MNTCRVLPPLAAVPPRAEHNRREVVSALLLTFPNSLIASVITSLSLSFSISARISSPSNMLRCRTGATPARKASGRRRGPAAPIPYVQAGQAAQARQADQH